MSLSSWIASVGQNVNFISFMAHMGFSFALLIFFPHVLTVGIILLAAAWKEFYFDIHYEANQTYKDGLLDFSGYTAGVILFFLKILTLSL